MMGTAGQTTGASDQFSTSNENRPVGLGDRYLANEWTEFSVVYDSDGNEVFDCKLPKDGERILVTVNRGSDEEVQLDTFFGDGDHCWLESCYTIIDEATAWMPLPKPFKPFENGGAWE